MSALSTPVPTPADAPVKPKRVRKAKPKAEVVITPPPVVETPARKPRVRKPKVVVETPPPADAPPADEPLKLVKAEPPVEGDLPPAPLVVATVTTDLSEDREREDFARLEEIVRKGLRAFYEVGNALTEIRDRKLFRHDGFLNFEDYISAKWDLGSRQRGHQLIEASTVVSALQAYYAERPGEEHPFLPLVESHARGMIKLVGRPEKLAEAWEKVIASAPVKHGAPHITGTHVEEVVREVMGLGKNPETGRGERNPTPGTQPDPVPPVVQTVTRPEDNEPPGVIAPPVGQEPDPLENGPTQVEVEEIEVLTQGEKVVLTPQKALEKVLISLKLGELSHKDPLIVSLLIDVNAGTSAWLDSEDDAVEWEADTDADEGEGE